MTAGIAIIGLACRYPDARSPIELWENVLAQRQAFRRMPPERLRLADYLSHGGDTSDSIYSTEAAVIEGYEFDRVRFTVAGDTFRSVDMAHWLALDVAAQALVDAGFPDGEALPRATTGVCLGNTLTGEFSRANLMRLRWPYVRRVLVAALRAEGWAEQKTARFLAQLEAQYKEPFPPVGDETLAGGLSNTIAGRICNHFGLNGGGYTVDGACAASLLAVTTSCSALESGDLDVALAGGVDLSLDPFELVGFSRVGALAREEMRIYDMRSSGFWPGEGCGVVVLMRLQDALAQDCRIYAVIRGWGVSSDGAGGLTRPEAGGQSLALRRAYRRAGFGIDSVTYIEGHGTGTSVGDATELKVLSQALREAAPTGPPAVIGSIKGNIGHTKAAAGVAGLIKATMAVYRQLLPPVTGCQEPQSELQGKEAALEILREGKLWPAERPLRAGVSAMGFGGINTHVVLEGLARERRTRLSLQERALMAAPQDAEVFLLGASETAALRKQVEQLLTFADRVSRAELADLAASLQKRLKDPLPVRAAIVAASPAQLKSGLRQLDSWLLNGIGARLDIENGIFLGKGFTPPRLGFLFPGQGSPSHLHGGAWRRRFDRVRKFHRRADLPEQIDGTMTEVAQPAIVTASLAALKLFDEFGIAAEVAVGHSLGELTALHWAGAISQRSLLAIARFRGKVMANVSRPGGAMVSVSAGVRDVEGLLTGTEVVVSGINASDQTVVSGAAKAVERVADRARARGWTTRTLPVSHAFHSPLVAAAAPLLARHLASHPFRTPRRRINSTVTGGPVKPDDDIRDLLCRQVTSPVRFMEALARAAEGLDLLIEVGPGEALTGLAGRIVPIPVVALDAGGPSLKGLLHAIGAAYVLGAAVRHGALFSGRFTRPFELDWRPRFLANPCEMAPWPDEAVLNPETVKDGAKSQPDGTREDRNSLPDHESTLDLVRRLVADHTELPSTAVRPDQRLLADLHLNSLKVSQLVAEASRRLELPPPAAPLEYSTVTVGEVARALEDLRRINRVSSQLNHLPGVDSWVRTFTVEMVDRTLPQHREVKNSPAIWEVLSTPNSPLAESLKHHLNAWGGSGGVILCLPPDPDEHHTSLLLQAVRAAIAKTTPPRFVLVQHGGGAAALARTVHLERPEITCCVVDFPWNHPRGVEWVLAEAQAATGYVEAHYDERGNRRVPILRLLAEAEPLADLPLGSADVLLVSGGGKGIAAECAFAIARETGVRLALLGRSIPEEDRDLASNLERMSAAGVVLRYVPADITDSAAVRSAIQDLQVNWGPITAFLHGAGTNSPQLLSSLDESAFLQTLAPKIRGLRNVLAVLNPQQLRLLVAFGSLIARTGMPGEADYAVANEWLGRLIEKWRLEHSHCRCLTIEWSVWSGVGMGERLGRVEMLRQQGITPIRVDEGVQAFLRLLRRSLPAVSIVVAGRFGVPPALEMGSPELPLWRFLEQPRVYYPGVELIVDTELSTTTDPYLPDHQFSSEQMLPAVVALEAMAQVASALQETSLPPIFEDVKFDRPVIVPKDKPTRIRLAALAREPNQIEVAVRCQETAFQVDHFRALCRFDGAKSADVRSTWQAAPAASTLEAGPLIELDPARDLYGKILFHGPRFQRLQRYRRLRATECEAEILGRHPTNWFSAYLPQKLLLGDPAWRDAAIHALQACIPHRTLLPIGVNRVMVSAEPPSQISVVRARERFRERDVFHYDLEVIGSDGVVESWSDLRLRAVDSKMFCGAWAEPLLGPYLERRVGELIPGSLITVDIEHDAEADRCLRAERALSRALGKKEAIRSRPDGKPEPVRECCVSFAHNRSLTLTVTGAVPVACDIEPVLQGPSTIWRDLLGENRFQLVEVIAYEGKEDESAAATRVWTAVECLKKIGRMVDAPLTFVSCSEDKWILFSSGRLVVTTAIVSVQSLRERLAVAIATTLEPVDGDRLEEMWRPNACLRVSTRCDP